MLDANRITCVNTDPNPYKAPKTQADREANGPTMPWALRVLAVLSTGMVGAFVGMFPGWYCGYLLSRPTAEDLAQDDNADATLLLAATSILGTFLGWLVGLGLGAWIYFWRRAN
jgi:hypothetical protein